MSRDFLTLDTFRVSSLSLFANTSSRGGGKGASWPRSQPLPFLSPSYGGKLVLETRRRRLP